MGRKLIGGAMGAVSLAADAVKHLAWFVSHQISDLFKVARDEGDYLSEQFVQWVLKEQVEEVATMTELLDVGERVRDFPMWLEEFIAREKPGGGRNDPGGPEPAGGQI